MDDKNGNRERILVWWVVVARLETLGGGATAAYSGRSKGRKSGGDARGGEWDKDDMQAYPEVEGIRPV